ncbi:ribonuclease H-like domain-containing protein [Tanacetum coccineum]
MYHHQKLPYSTKKGRIRYFLGHENGNYYLAATDYPFGTEVIQNGTGPVSITTYTQGQIKVLPLRTTEEILARERERKARTTLLMALPEDHLAKFHKMTDAKEMWDDILNPDWFQSLLSQLEIHGAGPDQGRQSQFDDLYNNLRVFENDVKGSTASSSSTQNVAFVSENTSSTNDLPIGSEDLEQLDEFDLEEMDLKWQVAMISMRMKKFYKKTGRKLQFDAKEPVGFDKTKVDCYNCHKIGHFARECRTKGNKKSRRKMLGTLAIRMGEDLLNTSGNFCSNGVKEFMLKTYKNLYDALSRKLSDASIEIKAYTQGLKKVEAQLLSSTWLTLQEGGMHAVTQPEDRELMPSGPLIVETHESLPGPTVNEPKVVNQPKVWSDAPMIEENDSDSEDEHVSQPTKNRNILSFEHVLYGFLHCISSKSGGWDQFGSNIATALICLSTGRVYNFSKLIFDGMVANLKSKTKFLMYPRFLQLILDIQTENKHPYLAVTLTKKIFGNMKRGFRGAPRPLLPAMLLVATTNPSAGQEHPDVAQSQPSSSTIPVPSTSLPPVQSPPPITAPIPASTPTPIPETDPEPMEHTFEEPSPAHQHFSPPQEHAQGQMTVDDLLQLVPQLMTRVDSLEKDLKQTKLTMGSAIVKLVKKVKKLEGILKRRNVVLSDSEEEEPEAQGRKSQDDPLVSLVQGLVTPSKTTVNASGEEQVEDISPTTLEAAKTLSRVASQKPKSIDKGRRYKRRKETKGKKVVTSLDFQEEVSTGYAEGVNTGSIKVSTVSGKVSTVSVQVSTDSINKSIPSPDKGQREGKAPMIIEEAPKKTKEQILQEEASLAEAIRLDTLEKEEEAKQVHLDSLLAQRIAEEEELNEQQKQRRAQVQFEAQHYTDEDWDLIRAKIKANAELSKSVLGSGLQGEDFAKKMVELGTWKLSQLKNLSFEEVKEEFDKLVKQVESFAPINFEATKDSLKRFGEELQTKTSKRLKSDEAKDDDKDTDPISGTNIPVNPVPVAMKPPSIATYKIIKQGKEGVYQIVREDGTDIVYINFGAMLKDITRDDLTELYRIVMNRYGMNGPEDELEKEQTDEGLLQMILEMDGDASLVLGSNGDGRTQTLGGGAMHNTTNGDQFYPCLN